MEWSHFGEVLFDIWFLFAASAVFIIIQQLYGFIKNTVQHVTA